MLKIFDALTFIGPYSRRELNTSPASLAAQLTTLSVPHALLVSLFAIEHEMEAGNAQALACARAYPGRFEPVAVVTPAQFIPDSGQMLRLRRAGFRVAAFFPGMQKWSLELLSFRQATREAAEADLVLLLVVGRGGEAARAAAVVGGIGTPVILRMHDAGGYELPHEFIAIGREFRNIFFDVWNCVGAGQIALLVRELGAERLVFGSGAPLCCARSALLLLMTSGVSNADLLSISGMTLRRILGDTEPGDTNANLGPDPVLACPKIDVHYHYGDWNLLIDRTSSEATSTELDTFGTQYVIMSSSAALRGDSAGGNAAVAEVLTRDHRFRGYIYLDPYNARQSALDLEHYGANPHFVGVKTRADYHGTTLEHPGYAPLLRRAGELGLPLLCHDAGVGLVATRMPGLNFIVAHSGPATAQQYADLPNIHFCIASSNPFMLGSDVRAMIARVGAGRILYGSDGPLISPAWTLGKLASADLSGVEAQQIFMDNALRLFGRLRQ